MSRQDSWFENWFDSPFYHILYNHRNTSEAEYFINNLFGFLNEKEKARVLDLACGKGRHARQVKDLGYDVVGIDLSNESIKDAKQYEDDNLHFETGDMRELPFSNHFDVVLNLFTSFGYFKKEGDNVKVISSVAESLKTGGTLVLDYLNVNKVKDKLPQVQEIQREDILFKVNKSIKDGFIVKDIEFNYNSKEYAFQEFVKLIDLNKFKEILELNKLKISAVFGDYGLNAFDAEHSDRLILIAKKK